ncbi:MAG: sulfatase-like hydrolase/transferase [Planctomycetota bacterium]|nr:sulfatase-like hydrolase/transferase [Planctomycetota bacterium]
MSHLNVLWITCDEMKANAVSTYGNRWTKMPAAERMAREGAQFDFAFCQMPKCVPSRCSMITGRYPHCDGYRTLKAREEFPPHVNVKDNSMVCIYEGVKNLVSMVRERGYKTCLLGKNHLVEWNLHLKWFDKTPRWKWEKQTYSNTPSERLQRASYTGTIKEGYNYDAHSDAMTASESIEFFEANKDKPFFALVDIGKPHPSYEDYMAFPASRIPLDEMPLPPCGPLDRAPTVERQIRTSKNLEDMTAEERKTVQRAYYSMCEFADAQVGKMLDALDRLGLAENTLVIYTADHGDFSGEHNCYEKWDTIFYDCIVRVPLLIRLPGRIKGGQKFPQLVELIDLAPTILDFMGEEIPRWMHGKSLKPLLEGKVATHKEAVFCQGGVEQELTRRPWRPEEPSVKQQVLLDFPDAMVRAKMVRTERYKYVYRLVGDCELFDLREDPHELKNLVKDPSCQAIVAEMKERMLRFMLETETNLPAISELHA